MGPWDLRAVPLPGLLSASWILTLAITLRYCQATVSVERQYDYLHELEEKVSRELGDEALYRREGRAYLDDYPLFQDWAYVCYCFLFPVAAAVATLALFWAEAARLPYPPLNKIFDAVIAAAVVVPLYLYRWHPPRETFGKLRNTVVERLRG